MSKLQVLYLQDEFLWKLMEVLLVLIVWVNILLYQNLLKLKKAMSKQYVLFMGWLWFYNTGMKDRIHICGVSWAAGGLTCIPCNCNITESRGCVVCHPPFSLNVSSMPLCDVLSNRGKNAGKKEWIFLKTSTYFEVLCILIQENISTLSSASSYSLATLQQCCLTHKPTV